MTTAKSLLIEKTEVTKSPKRYTLEEYFILEERSKHKHEFRNGEITQMAAMYINCTSSAHTASIYEYILLYFVEIFIASLIRILSAYLSSGIFCPNE